MAEEADTPPVRCAPLTLRQLLAGSTQALRQAGVPSPEVDARLLLEHALKVGPLDFLLRADREVTAVASLAVRALVNQRAARVPLQHLLGEVEWGGVRLRTDARALVPRPETERLLQLAAEELRQMALAAPRVLDVGTGTGALALALKGAFPTARVTASDLSAEALTLARENAALNGLSIECVQADLLSGVTGSFDLIVSNPPYLPDADRLNADPEVRHDPDLALYGGADGLNLARPLAAQAAPALAPGGLLLLELDPRNAAVLAAELGGQGWHTTILADLTGRERFVKARRE